MKSILIVAATKMEIEVIQSSLSKQNIQLDVDFMISDIGMMATAFHLTQKLNQQKYDLVLQIGIAGSFDHKINIGDVVEVVAEGYGDLGAEEATNQLFIYDLQLMQQDKLLFDEKYIYNNNTYTDLPKVKSISVNNCSGNLNTINYRQTYFKSDIESMEGIALHYVCNQLQQPYLQLRSISNYVTVRNKSSWNIPLALSNLSNFVLTFCKQYS